MEWKEEMKNGKTETIELMSVEGEGLSKLAVKRHVKPILEEMSKC